MNGNPADILTRLEGQRRDFYAASDAVLDTEVLDLQEVVLQISQLASLWGTRVG
jgi:hypothetical protein